MLTPNLLPLVLALTPTTNSAALPPLVVECPPLVKQFCGDPTDPSWTGLPTVTGACDENVQITWTDNVVVKNCEAQRFDRVIYRTFHVVDGCGNEGTCTQQIDVVKQVVVLDLHPRSCPNPFNRQGNGGVYPAAILGTPALDVTRIDPSSLKLWLQRCAGGPVVPIRFAYEDVSAPYQGGEDCGCTTDGPDGFMDLTFKFDKREMRDTLNLNAFPNMSFVRLFITGQFTDGCGFIGTDCIRVQ